MTNLLRRTIAALALFAAAQALQGENLPHIEVVGLFEGRAVIRIDGSEVMLKAGEVHGALMLEAADSRKAVIRYGEQRYELGLSERIASAFTPSVRQSVAIQINNRGQYVTTGEINGRPVRMLVDTGANIVAMNMATARSLGVSVSGARQVQTETAGGNVRSFDVRLETVAVGGIRVADVRATVLEGEHPRDVLLGMTFLRSVEIRESGGVLQLTTEF